MAFLGTVHLGATLTISVAWTLQDADVASGSELTLTHDRSGTVVGPLAGVGTGVNQFEVETSLEEGGRWTAKWFTDPPGGVTEDSLYVEP